MHPRAIVDMGGSQRHVRRSPIKRMRVRERTVPFEFHSTSTMLPPPGGTSAVTSSVTDSPTATSVQTEPLAETRTTD